MADSSDPPESFLYVPKSDLMNQLYIFEKEHSTIT